MIWSRHFFRSILVSTVSVAVVLLVAEVALRFMPSVRGLPAMVPVNAEQPVFRFKANSEFLFSKSWNFEIVNRGRINNFGFVNDQNYTTSGARPLIAVVGDSYIEALMVAFENTLHGRMAAAVGARGRVYSFAFSGAPLSQYLAWIKYARETFQPDAYVVNVVGNDFDQSLDTILQGPGFHHYARVPGGGLELKLNDYEPGLLAQTCQVSALCRYLMFNLEAHQAVSRFASLFHSWLSLADQRRDGQDPSRPIFVGNTLVQADEQRLSSSFDMLDAFFRDLELETGVPPRRTLFVVDGLRSAIYGTIASDYAESSYFGMMRRALIDRAEAKGYPVVDLQDAFARHFAIHHTRFEFDHDWHWNSVGHAVASDAVMQTDWFKHLFRQ